MTEQDKFEPVTVSAAEDKLSTSDGNPSNAARDSDMQRLLGLITICGAIAASVYGLLYLFTGIWQILIETGFAFLAVIFLALGYIVAGRRKPELAGYLAMLALFIGMGGAELVWSGASLFLTLGAIFLIILCGSFVLPGKWELWLTVSGLYVGWVWVVNRYEPIPRYDVSQLPALNTFLPVIIGAVILGIGWQIFRVFKTGTILIQLLITMVALVSVVVILIVSTTAYLDFRRVNESAADKLQAIVAFKAKQISNWQSIVSVEINSSLINDDLLPALELFLFETGPDLLAEQTHELIQSDLRERIVEEGHFDRLFVLNQAGRVVISTEASEEGMLQDQADYFREGLKGFYHGSIRRSGMSGKLDWVVARPLLNTKGETIGVLAGYANLEPLQSIALERTGLGLSGETFLVGKDSTLLTPLRSGSGPVGESIGPNEEIAAILNAANEDTQIYENYMGQTVVGAYAWLPELEAALIGEESQREIVGEAYNRVTITAGVSVAAIFLAVLSGILITRSITSPLTTLAETAQQVAAGNLSLHATIRREDEIGLVAQAFNQMTDQFRELVDSLEDRIQARTRALETSAQISRQLNNILEVDPLLEQVVTKIQEAFNYYHVHIYLIDTEYNNLVMREGTGEVGKLLKAKDHRLRLGQGIVGSVAQNNQPFLATDVSQIPYFHANPLLPRTKAELAVPVQKGDRVLGVLDLQSEEVNGFSEQDLTLMQSIADQVAVALDNARLFQASQAAVAEVEALNARLTRQLWESAVQKVEQSAFVYANKTVSPAAGTWLPTMTEAVKHKDFVHRLYPAESESDPAASTLAVPLILRGQMIGVIGIERALEADILSVGSDETGSWSEDELITIRAVSEQIALALDSARLARDTERAAWRDRLVSEATARVWASSEIEAVMQAAIAQLGDKLGAAEVVIRLGTEDKLFEF